ncbi:GTP-binding protein, partial [Candidatus Micrarchaeota archaeon]|nr:GTP-binding protein [Candidatus Micrarchaeota archaeon]MBU1939725.1 GTP-binding protein [Candidatus Micrarchaeota archaeon]
MPSNVSFEYTKAQGKYEQASTNSEKLAALQEMRSTAPKHKGAEKLRAEISGKLARLKRDMEKQREQAKKTSGGKSLNVRKEGAGQVVLVGMPNSGKSTLL